MEEKELIEAELKADKKKYFLRIIGLIVTNTILFLFLIKGPRSTTDNLIASANANLIGFNILGVVLGAFVAIFPHKKLSYRKKYFRAVLLAILTMQLIMFVGLILIGVMTILGWY